ncbi:methyltransferase domain-containing protein [Patescibacteria group bacterium]
MDSKKKSTQQTYSSIASLYTEDFGKDREDFEIFIYKAIDRLKTLSLKGSVVDLGSGPGNVVDYLIEKGVDNKIIANEFTPEFSKALEEKYSQSNQVSINSEDMVKFVPSLKESSISLYIANYSIIHIPDDEVDPLFNEIYKTLEPKGLFVLAVWGGSKKDMEEEPYQIENDKRLNTNKKLLSYMNNFSKDEMKHRLTNAGFTSIETKVLETEPVPGSFNQPRILAFATK